uniref:NADH dehydrogenase [ubiquinone] 1 alpha subcomplex subunit 3 n=1 Tax=Balaenoptera musculus TaxID=9771 RepID=A0A8C0CDS0_BALMU
MAVKLTAFIKNAWAGASLVAQSRNCPILHHLGLAIILPTLGPYTMYNVLVNQVTPYSHPELLRDDGNVPSYPQDTKMPWSGLGEDVGFEKSPQ